MKRTLINDIPYAMPSDIESFVRGAKIYDSSCSPEARVYFIDKDNGYYLKRSPLGSLSKEAAMTSYFHSKGLGTDILLYLTDGESDWMLTEKARGEDCTHREYLDDPKRLCDIISEELRKLHETDFTGCPVTNRNESYISLANENFKKGLYDTSYYSEAFGDITAEKAFAILEDGKSGLRADVLLHGDYCLPNIMLDSWKLSSFIDLGNGGVGDRHIDIFWGAWTLNFNLKTDAYRERFFDGYGRDKIDAEMLRVIAATEVFG